ncbi:hypothetical protein V1478_000240 [Vespula squamosa]|uniref:Uncharacterized protein n=1 Tax=Vespula squamosa TaxID=30214 RepID=A0ABD2C5T6_VESSQ
MSTDGTLAYVTYETTPKSATLRLKQFVIRECFFARGYVKNGKHHEGDRRKREKFSESLRLDLRTSSSIDVAVRQNCFRPSDQHKDPKIKILSSEMKHNLILAITSNLNVTFKQLTINRDTVKPNLFPNAPNARS